MSETKTEQTVAKTTTQQKKGSYIEAVGRRKMAVARVRISEVARGGASTINERSLESYFPTNELRTVVRSPFAQIKVLAKFNVSAIITGSGVHSQAEALRHGISRALVIYNAELRGKLKKLGFLKRDPRTKERRKFGLKKARKAPQWSKR